MNRRISALAISAVFLLGLTACAGGGETTDENTDSNSSENAPAEETTTDEGTEEEAPEASGDQSVEDACGIVSSAGASQASDAMSAMGEGDMDAAIESLGGAADELDSKLGEISNEEVLPVATSVRDDMTRLVELLPKAQEGDTSAASELSDLAQSLTEAQTELVDLCAA